MKKVLITGLSGFIGSHTLEFLIKKNYEIHAISTCARENTEVINWHHCDIFNVDKVNILLSNIKPKYLLHLAWDVTPGEYMESPLNYEWLIASINLIRSFQANSGQRVVIAGTQMEYISDSPYPATKRALLEVIKSLGLSYASGRVFNLFGENERPERLIPYTIDSLLKDQEVICKTGEKEIDLLYVKDVARAFVEILNSEVQGIIDIGSGNSIKIKDLVNMIASIYNKNELVSFVKPMNTSINEKRIIANTNRLRNDVGFIPEYPIKQAIKRIIESTSNDKEKRNIL